MDAAENSMDYSVCIWSGYCPHIMTIVSSLLFFHCYLLPLASWNEVIPLENVQYTCCDAQAVLHGFFILCLYEKPMWGSIGFSSDSPEIYFVTSNSNWHTQLSMLILEQLEAQNSKTFLLFKIRTEQDVYDWTQNKSIFFRLLAGLNPAGKSLVFDFVWIPQCEDLGGNVWGIPLECLSQVKSCLSLQLECDLEVCLASLCLVSRQGPCC